MSEQVPEGPHERLVGRLRELSDAVTQGPEAVRREFTMRVPAEPERDADLVLSTAAAELDRLRAQNEALGRENQSLRAAQVAVARLRYTPASAGETIAYTSGTGKQWLGGTVDGA